MDSIVIQELEVFYRVGVPEEERAQAQRLLLTVIMEQGLERSAAADDLQHTIDYHAVAQRLLKLGEGRAWKLIETVAEEVARTVLREFKPRRVCVEVKKFILPQAACVAVRIERE